MTPTGTRIPSRFIDSSAPDPHETNMRNARSGMSERAFSVVGMDYFTQRIYLRFASVNPLGTVGALVDYFTQRISR